jgi:hypothetical protein
VEITGPFIRFHSTKNGANFITFSDPSIFPNFFSHPVDIPTKQLEEKEKENINDLNVGMAKEDKIKEMEVEEIKKINESQKEGQNSAEKVQVLNFVEEPKINCKKKIKKNKKQQKKLKLK